MERRYGYIRDHYDERDYVAKQMLLETALPPHRDLRFRCPSVYDQGNLGSCTGNAIAAAVEVERAKQNLPFIDPSRLFIYYNERAMEGTVDEDAGAEIRDGIKVVAKQGVCPEPLWPYDISKFAIQPSDSCYLAALKYQALRYMRVPQDLLSLKSCLAEGFAFVFGFIVYESFESSAVAQTGVVPMPGAHESILGGHAVLAVGYDDASERFIVRNSWGTDWGQHGYFTMPYHYLVSSKLVDDIWSIRFEETNK